MWANMAAAIIEKMNAFMSVTITFERVAAVATLTPAED